MTQHRFRYYVSHTQCRQKRSSQGQPKVKCQGSTPSLVVKVLLDSFSIFGLKLPQREERPEREDVCCTFYICMRWFVTMVVRQWLHLRLASLKHQNWSNPSINVSKNFHLWNLNSNLQGLPKKKLFQRKELQ